MKLALQIAVILQCVALMVWVGGLLFFAFVAAPLTFQPDVLSRTGGTHVSGMIVNAMLARFTWWQTLCAAVVLAALLWQFIQVRRRRLWIQIGITLVMTLLLAWYGWIIGPRMQDLRTQIGDFNAASATTPGLTEFEALHVKYVRLMGANLVLGVILFGMAVVMVPSVFRDRERARFTSIPV